MVYLEYQLETKQVVEIHENQPTFQEGYEFAVSNEFAIGDEFERTFWINEVNENRDVTSYSAIRNNPQAKRLLEENQKLKAENKNQKQQLEQINNDLLAFMDYVTTGGM